MSIIRRLLRNTSHVVKYDRTNYDGHIHYSKYIIPKSSDFNNYKSVNLGNIDNLIDERLNVLIYTDKELYDYLLPESESKSDANHQAEIKITTVLTLSYPRIDYSETFIQSMNDAPMGTYLLEHCITNPEIFWECELHEILMALSWANLNNITPPIIPEIEATIKMHQKLRHLGLNEEALRSN